MKFKLKTIFIFLILKTGYGQEVDIDKNITFGIYAGMNLNYFNSSVSRLANDDTLLYEDHYRISGQLGLNLSYNINEYLNIESGIRYIGKGMEYRKKENSVINIGAGAGEDNYLRTIFRLDFIEIPIVGNINLKKIFDNIEYNGKPFYLGLGFITGFNINSDIKSNSYTPTSSSSNSFLTNVKENFDTTEFEYANPILFSYAVSTKFIVQDTKKNRFWVGLEYNQSINEVYDETLDDSDYNYKSKMGSFLLNLMVEFL